jgi:hypothetical protein
MLQGMKENGYNYSIAKSITEKSLIKRDFSGFNLYYGIRMKHLTKIQA